MGCVLPVGATWYAGLLAGNAWEKLLFVRLGPCVVVMISASDLVDGTANRRKERPRYGWQGLEGALVVYCGSDGV